MRFRIIKEYKFTITTVCLVILGGVFGGVIVASILALLLLFIKNEIYKLEILFVLILIIFFLGDNFEGVLSFAQDLRFVILGIGLFILYWYSLFKLNSGFYILPFSLVATLITYNLSPLGFEATIRGLSYLLVALVIFKCVQLLIARNATRFYNLILIILSIYFLLNILLLFVPFVGVEYVEGRYTGLMANPNGLGLIAMLSYAIADVIKRRKLHSFNPLFFSVFKIILIGLIILTASRTSLFGVFLYVISTKLIKHKILLSLTLVIMLISYSLISSLNVEELIVSLGLGDYFRVETLVDASGRTEVWETAIEEINRQPWLGKGMLYDNYYINNYGERYIGEFRARHWYGIWNSYLSLLLNVGIIGLLAFAYFWYKMYTLSTMKIARFAFLVMCLFSAISESWMAASMNAFMPLVFICWALQIYEPKKEIQIS